MKKISLTLLFAAAIAFAGSTLITSCGSKTNDEAHEEETTEEMHDDDANHEHEGDDDDTLDALTYACPMHPEEKGKEGDTCSKCKMALVKIETETEEVVEQ